MIKKSVSEPNKYKDSQYGINSNFFKEQFDDFYEKAEKSVGIGEANEQLIAFSDFILDRVYLLFIETPNFEDALTIFNTVNNRGMQLADGDIIKAALFDHAGEENEKFCEQWDEILEKLCGNNDNDNDDDKSNEVSKPEIEALIGSLKDKQSPVMTNLFHFYMHVLRAQNEKSHDTVGLRAFFIDGKNIGSSKKFKEKENEDGNWHKIGHADLPWTKVMEDLNRLAVACQIAVSDAYPQVSNWLTALRTFGKRDCLIPPLVWLFKNLEFRNEGENNEKACLSEEKLAEGDRFFRSIVRFALVASIQGGQQVSNKLFEAAVTVYTNEVWTFDCGNIEEYLRVNSKTPVPLGLVYVLELLRIGNKIIIPLGEIEHILPIKSNRSNSTGWNEGEKNEAKLKLGNLVLLEKKINTSAGNKSFADKKDSYVGKGGKKGSDYATVQDVAKLSQWLYADWKKRHEESVQQILAFLRGDVSSEWPVSKKRS